MYNIVSSGSKGNAVLYFDSVMVDCGVSFSSVKPYLYDLQLILLTHRHGDHFNESALRRLVFERPTLRIGCCEWMADKISFAKNVDIYKIGRLYNYGSFQVAPFKLYHDVPNAGYRIFKNGKKIFHATDTAHLKGITAIGYDLYSIEHNFNEETVFDMIYKTESSGGYAYQRESINSHLSEQDANDFFYRNKGENSVLVRLHESSTYL